MADPGGLRPFAFVLAVRDFVATAGYFRDCLGFSVKWAEATDWRLLSRGTVRVMIGRCPDVAPASAIGDHSYVACLEVDDIDALHAEWQSRGALIRQPPADRPYGMRKMMVATPDGHRIVVGQARA
jgi:uncharacterized glyoxalase superfamily protein PhnB